MRAEILAAAESEGEAAACLGVFQTATQAVADAEARLERRRAKHSAACAREAAARAALPKASEMTLKFFNMPAPDIVRRR